MKIKQLHEFENGAVHDVAPVTIPDAVVNPNTQENLTVALERIETAIDGKVEKVDGKQLSTEDFTTILKQKLEGLSNYDDTAINEAVEKLRTDFDTLVSGDTATAIESFNEIIAFLTGIEDSENLDSIIASIQQQIADKQDVITDLETIRQGAAKGATALQEHQDISHLASKDDIITVTNGDGTKYLSDSGEYKEVEALPSGGTSGQVLTKTEDGAEWQNPQGGEANVQAVDTEESVDEPDMTYLTTAPQTLTDEQKNQVKENLGISAEDIDLSDYAKTEDIPAKLSELENDVPYVVDDVIPENGVYAVAADGSLVSVEEADESCIAVALIQGEHQFMIEKNETNNAAYNGKYTFVWGNANTNLSLADYKTADGTNSIVYFGENISPQISRDYTTWINGAISDFDGKSNTDVIIAALNTNSYMGAVLNNFNAASDQNSGYSDWYIPSCGQLALIGLSYADINSAFSKINGVELDYKYLSSTEYGIDTCWGVDLGYRVYPSVKDESLRVRFIRDLSIRPVKDRISVLESTKQDTLVSGTNIKTINGESILGEGDIATKVQIVDHGTDDTTFSLTPNVLHKWGTVASLNLTLAATDDDRVANYYMAEFTSGTTATTLSVPDTITWSSDVSIEAGKTYQISILNGCGVIGGF